eukprot:3043107-Rhodomonas_salina.1
MIDISHAYYHVMMNKAYCKYMCFRWLGKVYCYTALCFGISPAPRIFTAIVKTIVSFWRCEHGIRCSNYIDDLTSCALNPTLGSVQGCYQISHLQALGWIIQMKK